MSYGYVPSDAKTNINKLHQCPYSICLILYALKNKSDILADIPRMANSSNVQHMWEMTMRGVAAAHCGTRMLRSLLIDVGAA